MPEQLIQQASRLMQLNRWPEARSVLQQLAILVPRQPRYRAWLALARGEEHWLGGDERRARAEWKRALVLDPTLDEAQLALRRRGQGWVRRISSTMTGRLRRGP